MASFQLQGDLIHEVVMKSGRRAACGQVVNAAGPMARSVAALAGLDLPVHPRKRLVFSFDCPHPTPGMPMLICPNGVYVRSEGRSWICGVSPPAHQDPDCLDFEVDESLFMECIWPTLANRIPIFERLKLTGSWAGHYAYNVMDQNAVLGAHPKVKNLCFANGFSGHGLQQSPAMGRAVAELIVSHQFQSIDLTAFHINRFEKGHLIRERNVV